MLLHQVGQIGEVSASSTGVNLSPFALESFAGGGDSDINILLGSLVNGDDWLLVGGIDGLECLAVDAFHPFVVDEAVPRLSASCCCGLVGLAPRQEWGLLMMLKKKGYHKRRGETHSPVG